MSGDKSTGKPPRPAKKQFLGWLDRFKRLRFFFQRKSASALLDDPSEHLASIKQQAAADSSEAALMRAALKGVLDQHASSRAVLVHLSVLEKALGRHGLKALEELPLDVLRRAMAQLETLVSDWSPGNLAALRARLTEALIKQRRANDRRRTTERLSDFEDSRQLQVKEASVSRFMEANARWQRSLTGQKL
jgi:hypothetical protein